ncbi:MAG: adenylosuccinate lyase, partial [Bacteroidota bacterium]
MADPTNPAALNAISPVDGRYSRVTQPLQAYFSEAALFRYRMTVEVMYFRELCQAGLPQLQGVQEEDLQALLKWLEGFGTEDVTAIKAHEATTNHDVKAVEYHLKDQFDRLGLSEYKEFIHFGLTSQDINNTAVPLSIREALEREIYPALNEVLQQLTTLANDWQAVPMLARTHGQPASPTRLGKEVAVFLERLKAQYTLLWSVPVSAKFGGATGNFNAHHVAYPEIDWVAFANRFVGERLGLDRAQTTTQIEHYDHLAALCDAFRRINTVLIDLCRDMWTYISMDYFKQQIKENEVGSSAMPHKVNPIDFENAEGNLGIANAIFGHLAEKLPISRLQRDLTDSTVLRNIGVPFAHTLIAWRSLLKGLGKVVLNEAALEADLEANWAVVAEAIQTILRREGYPK